MYNSYLSSLNADKRILLKKENNAIFTDEDYDKIGKIKNVDYILCYVITSAFIFYSHYFNFIIFIITWIFYFIYLKFSIKNLFLHILVKLMQITI